MIIEARICAESDVPALTAFMKAEWDSRHIMANDRGYLDFFFRDSKSGKYNTICAFDQSGEIAGFIAYVKASRYDGEIPAENDLIWVTNWIASEKAKTAGLILFAKMIEVSGCKNIGVIGQNRLAENIYRKMGHAIGALGQYFIYNNKRGGREFAELGFEEIMKITQSTLPYKTPVYIINKYLRSPFYKYMAYGARDGAVIFRIQEYPGQCRRCIRIVEFFGDYGVLSGRSEEFQALLRKFDAEYLDFYCAGIPEEILESAGFEKNVGQALLPNYFEPFVNENIEIRYAYRFNKKIDGFAVYKGDGDREFPRIIHR